MKVNKIKALQEEHNAQAKQILDIRRQLCMEHVMGLDEIAKWKETKVNKVYEEIPVLRSEEYNSINEKIKEVRSNRPLSSESMRCIRKLRDQRALTAGDLNEDKREKALHRIEMEEAAKRLFLEECFRTNCELLRDDELKLKLRFEEAMREAGCEDTPSTASALC